MRKEILFVGSGGQGIILGGHILTEAAGIYDGKEVSNSERYGAAARGGVTVSEVIISDEEIDYPKITMADYMICLSQKAYDTYKHIVKAEGLVIADPFYVKNISHKNVCLIPLSGMVREKTGREIGTNIAALGVFVRVTNLISEDAIRKAVEKRVPKGTKELNMSILNLGLGYKLKSIEAMEREQDLQEEYISILEGRHRPHF